MILGGDSMKPMPAAGELAALNDQPGRPKGRPWIIGTVAFSLFALAAFGSQVNAADWRKATTSRAARDEAIQAIPFEHLANPERGGVQQVVQNTSIYRRMPTQVIDCDPHLYGFLLEHPEVIVGIWDAMGISNVSLKRTGETTFRAADGEGTLGDIKVAYASHDKYLLYANGSYDGPLFQRPVRAQCVLLLRSGAIRETNGRHYITCRLDTFIHLQRVGVELLAKTIQPLIGRSADSNFTETMAFVASLSRAAEYNPRGVERIAGQLTGVAPLVRDDFLRVAGQVPIRSAQATNVVATRPATGPARDQSARR